MAAISDEEGAGGEPGGLERARGVVAALAATGQPVTIATVRAVARVRNAVAAQAVREARDGTVPDVLPGVLPGMLPGMQGVLPPLGPNVAGETAKGEVLLVRGDVEWTTRMLLVLLGRGA